MEAISTGIGFWIGKAGTPGIARGFRIAG